MIVVWTKKAEITHQENLNYLEKDWPNTALLKYLDQLDSVIYKISVNPNLFPLYNKKKHIHKCVINKKISVYYKFKNNTIILLVFWNNLQEPKLKI